MAALGQPPQVTRSTCLDDLWVTLLGGQPRCALEQQQDATHERVLGGGRHSRRRRRCCTAAGRLEQRLRLLQQPREGRRQVGSL